MSVHIVSSSTFLHDVAATALVLFPASGQPSTFGCGLVISGGGLRSNVLVLFVLCLVERSGTEFECNSGPLCDCFCLFDCLSRQLEANQWRRTHVTRDRMIGKRQEIKRNISKFKEERKTDKKPLKIDD